MSSLLKHLHQVSLWPDDINTVMQVFNCALKLADDQNMCLFNLPHELQIIEPKAGAATTSKPAVPAKSAGKKKQESSSSEDSSSDSEDEEPAKVCPCILVVLHFFDCLYSRIMNQNNVDQAQSTTGCCG